MEIVFIKFLSKYYIQFEFGDEILLFGVGFHFFITYYHCFTAFLRLYYIFFKKIFQKGQFLNNIALSLQKNDTMCFKTVGKFIPVCFGTH